MSVGRNVPYPGGFSFIRQVADEQQDGSLTSKIGQLAPVNQALAYIQNAATSADPAAREDLLHQAEDQIAILQAGATAVSRALEHVSSTYVGESREPHPFALAPKPPRGTSTRPGYDTINSAPIDSEAMGVRGTAKPPGWDAEQAAIQRQRYDAAVASHRHIQAAGTDEEAQASPPQPDTGVNQSQNQVNVQRDVFKPMAARSWKEGGNAPDPALDTPETFDSYPIQGLRPRAVMETRPDESPRMRLAAGEGPGVQESGATVAGVATVDPAALMEQPSDLARTFNAQQEPAPAGSTSPLPEATEREQTPAEGAAPAEQSATSTEESGRQPKSQRRNK